MSEKNIAKLNPWTGHKAKAKTDGKFFSLIAHHYPHLDQSNNLKKIYKKLSALIQAPFDEPTLEEYRDLIDIQKKVNKIDQILDWIQKIQTSQTLNQSKESLQELKQAPIDSSYVYLPLHSGTVFHQLLKQASTLHWDGLVHERTVKKIQREIQEMQQILTLNGEIMKNIIL